MSENDRMQPGAITFDFHDTLVYCDDWFQLEVFHLPSAFLRWHERTHHSLADASAGAGLDHDYRRLRSSIIHHGHELNAERSIAVTYARAGIRVNERVIAEGVHELMSGALGGIHAVPGAIETVRALAGAGIALGVVSSAIHHPFLEWALDKLSLLRSFTTVVTSASAGYYKSRPEIFWHAMTNLGANPAVSLHIGDSARFDVDGAARAGMKSVWLDRGGSNKPGTDPSLVVQSLEGVAPQLLKMLAESS